MAESKLRVDILANVQGFDRAMMKAQSRLKSFGQATTRIGTQLSLGLTAPLTIAGTLAVRQAINFEKLQTTLNVLTGSADNGAKAFERLVRFSAKTPFQLPDLIKVNNVLMGFGMSADSAFVNLKRLGDIAGVTGGDLNGIAIAFGQASAEGRLLTRDLRQFINNGVPVIQILAQEMGVAEGEIMDLASQGKITFDILENAFKNATSEGGKFAGGTKILSQTLGGLFSTFKDNVNIALAEFGQAISEAFNLSENIPKIANFIGNLTQKFRELSPETQRFVVVFGGISALIGPLLIVVGKLSLGFKALVPVISGIGKLFVALLSPVGILTAGLVGIATIIAVNFNEILPVLVNLYNRFVDLYNGSETLRLAIAGLKSVFATVFISIKTKVMSVINVFKTFGNVVKEVIDKRFKADLPGVIGEGIEKGAQIVADGANEIKNAFVDNFSNALGSRLEHKTVDEVKTGISNIVSKVKDFAFGGFDFNFDDLFKSPTGGDTDGGLTDINTQTSEQGQQLVGTLVDVSGGVQNALANIGQAIGSGNIGIGEVGGMLLSTLGDIAIHLGKTAIKIGLAMEAIKMSFKNPFTAIMAGIALVAIGSFIKNAGNIVSGGSAPTAFAKGGVVTGPTLGLIGEGIGTNRGNPEIVAPLDRLQSIIQPRNQKVEVGGQFSINGQDLVLVLQRANSDRTRLV